MCIRDSTTRPWLFWWPGMIILAIALSVNFLGDGLRDAFDPRQGAGAHRRPRFFGRRAAATEAGATTAGGLAAAPTAGRIEAPVEAAGGSARISDADEDGQR